MNQRYWQRAAKTVRSTLTHLTLGNEGYYFSIGRIHRYGMAHGWKRECAPRTPEKVEKCLDILVERGEVEMIPAQLGDSTNDLKLYRRKFKC